MYQAIPRGLKPKPARDTDYVKGSTSPIPYVLRLPSGNWKPYLTTKQPQKYSWWETNCCWCTSGINDIETQCNFLKVQGQFPKESLDFFEANGYFDANGNFDFSERYISIIAGSRDEGNDQMELWRLSRLNGVLPRKDLNYTNEQASRFSSQAEFANDYFDPSAIKPAMRQKALKTLEYIDIAYERVGRAYKQPNIVDLRACLYQAPLQLGVPVADETWNSGTVIYNGENKAEHAILGFYIDNDGLYHFRDTYNPYDKTLSKNYFIPLVTNGVVTPIIKPPYVAPPTATPFPDTIWAKVWKAVREWFRSHIDF